MRTRIFYFFFLSVGASASEIVGDNKIAGGEDTEVTKHPWHVAIVWKGQGWIRKV